MNLALSAVIATVLFLPGFLFRFQYTRSNSFRKTTDVSIVTVFIIVPSLVLHILGIYFVRIVLSKSPSIEQVLLILMGKGDKVDFNIVDNSLVGFLVYILVLCFIGAFMGRFFQRIVIWKNLDEKYKVLRIYNDWDKYFSGQVLPPAERVKIDFIQVDVVVNMEEGDMLYTGVLQNYSLNKDQGIDQLFLSNVYRRKFKDDLDGPPRKESYAPSGYPIFRIKDYDGRYHALPGAYFVIPFGEIRNLNIIYNTLEEVLE